MKVVEARSTLPPKVEGLERGNLSVSFHGFTLDRPTKPSTVQAKPIWWGEEPEDADIVTVAPGVPVSLKYTLRCGPKFFHRYLEDMEHLIVEITDPDRAGQILGICRIDLASVLISRPHMLRAVLPMTTKGGRAVGTLDVGIDVLFNEVVDSFEMNEFFAEYDRTVALRASQQAAPPSSTLQKSKQKTPPASPGPSQKGKAAVKDDDNSQTAAEPLGGPPPTAASVAAADKSRAEAAILNGQNPASSSNNGGNSSSRPASALRQSREALPLVEQPTSHKSGSGLGAPGLAASSTTDPILTDKQVRTSMEMVKLRPIEEWAVTEDMPDHAACVVQLAAQVRSDPSLVRQVFTEIASSRTRTSRVPSEILSQDIVRAHRLLSAPSLPPKTSSDFLDLMLGLGPVDPTDKRTFTVTPDEFTAALYDSANAVQLVYSEDRRRVADLMQGFTIEAGRRQLEVQNRFREIGWNQGGELTTRQLALVLTTALPDSSRSEVRMALAYLDRIVVASGRARHVLEDVRTMMRELLEEAASPPAGFQAPPPKKARSARKPRPAAAATAAAKPDVATEKSPSPVQDDYEDLLQVEPEPEPVEPEPKMPPPSQILAQRARAAPAPAQAAPAPPAPPRQEERVLVAAAASTAPPAAVTAVSQSVAAPLQQTPVIVQQPVLTPGLVRVGPLDHLIHRALGLRQAMDVALTSGPIFSSHGQAPAPSTDTRKILETVTTPLTAPHQLPTAVARALASSQAAPQAAPYATYTAVAAPPQYAAPAAGDSTDMSGTDVSSVVEDAIMSELFFGGQTRPAVPSDLSWMPADASQSAFPPPAPLAPTAQHPAPSSAPQKKAAASPASSEPPASVPDFSLVLTVDPGEIRAKEGTKFEGNIKAPGGLVLASALELRPSTKETLQLPLPQRLIAALQSEAPAAPKFLVLEVLENGQFAALAKFPLAKLAAAEDKENQGAGGEDQILPEALRDLAVHGQLSICDARADVYHPVRATGLGTASLAAHVTRTAPPPKKEAPAATAAAPINKRDRDQNPEEDLIAIRHTFDIQVQSLSRLPPVSAYAGGKGGRTGGRSKLPQGRYIKYFFPGEPEPLETRVFPPEEAIKVGASARHTVTLPPQEDLLHYIAGPGGSKALRFEVWTKWDRGSDSKLCSAEVDLSDAAAAAGPSQQLFHLTLAPEAKSVEALLLRHPTIKLQVGYHRDLLSAEDPLNESDLRALEAHAKSAHDQSNLIEGIYDGIPSKVAGDFEERVGIHRPLPIVLPAVIKCEVVRAMGLGAAVQEASLYFGTEATPLLGRASSLGPHSYARLSLFPGDEDLESAFPTLRTPFQAQTFAPEYGYAREYGCKLQDYLIRALAVGEAAIELWHHSPRSQMTPFGPLPPGADKSPVMKLRDVFLGQGAVQLAPLLTCPRGIDTWVPLRSRRGEHVGCVQVRLQLLVPGLGLGQDQDPDARPDSEFYRDGETRPDPDSSLRQDGGSGLAVLDMYPELCLALTPGLEMPTAAKITGQLIGRAARAHLFIEEVILPGGSASLPPTPSDPSDPAKPVLPNPDRPKAASYYAQWAWPGSSLTDRSPAKGPTSPSAPWMPWRVPLKHSSSTKLVLFSHVLHAMTHEPLKVDIWRQDPPRTATGLGQLPPPTLLGTAHIDLLPLLSGKKITLNAAGVGLKAGTRESKWLSGSYFLVNPAAKNLAGAKARIRLMMEVFPGPPAVAAPAPPLAPPAALEEAIPEEEGEEEGGVNRASVVLAPPRSPAGLRSRAREGFLGAPEEEQLEERASSPVPEPEEPELPAPPAAEPEEQERKEEAHASLADTSGIEPLHDLSTLTEGFEEESREAAANLPGSTQLNPLPAPPVPAPAPAPPAERRPGDLYSVQIDRALHVALAPSAAYSEAEGWVEAAYGDGVEAFCTPRMPLEGDCATWMHTAHVPLTCAAGGDTLLVLRLCVSQPALHPQPITVGCAVVDLGPLSRGMPELEGYYNLVDFTQKVRGQIKVGVRPFRQPRHRLPALIAPTPTQSVALALTSELMTLPALPTPESVRLPEPEPESERLDASTANLELLDSSTSSRGAREKLQQQLQELENMLERFNRPSPDGKKRRAAEVVSTTTSMTGFGLQPNRDEPVWTRAHHDELSSLHTERYSASPSEREREPSGASSSGCALDRTGFTLAARSVDSGSEYGGLLPPPPPSLPTNAPPSANTSLYLDNSLSYSASLPGTADVTTQLPPSARASLASAPVPLPPRAPAPAPRPPAMKTLSDDDDFTPAIGVGFSSDDEDPFGLDSRQAGLGLGPGLGHVASVSATSSQELKAAPSHPNPRSGLPPPEAFQSIDAAEDWQLEGVVADALRDRLENPYLRDSSDSVPPLMRDPMFLRETPFMYGFARDGPLPTMALSDVRSSFLLNIESPGNETPSASALASMPSTQRDQISPQPSFTPPLRESDKTGGAESQLSQGGSANVGASTINIPTASSSFSWNLPPREDSVAIAAPSTGMVDPNLPDWARELLQKKKEKEEAEKGAMAAARARAGHDIYSILTNSGAGSSRAGGGEYDIPSTSSYPTPGKASFKFTNALPPGPANN